MHQLVRARRSTPHLLLAAGVGVLVMALLAGVLGWQGLVQRADALERARAETAQQVKIQTARTTLVIADTNAGNDVLTGADPTQFRYKQFEFKAQPALLGLVVAARVDADAATLATANRFLTSYAMQVQSARTLARNGQDKEATATLSAASALLHAEVLPRLADVQNASQERLEDDQAAADLAPIIALLVGIAAVLVIAGVHLWLTRRTRRLLNLGLVGCVLVLIVATGAGAIVVAGSRDKVVDAEENALEVVDFLVEARFSAFDARSGEALAVLNGGTAENEQKWSEQMEQADWYLQRAGQGQSSAVRADVAVITEKLAAYRERHQELLAQAQAGNTRAVQNIAANPAPEGSVGSFEEFDTYSGALLARQVQAADDAWESAGSNLRLVGWLTLVIGVLAAVLAWAGIAARRREYR
ncbi:hypothetical protein [Kineosporia babensis]|uniref:Secreted protein n=1 Tax=Kineosporia babensis TaxID=499548 RepID=A0A9X1T0M7_9ACTN|nr:hypothetical protein [Kineosporia babensis]MCD5312913.1 hypothetical protein [Kineosporia babensis]